jgi:SAM-dependent methyltransferase
LELGCGTGEFTKRVVSTGADITAIDISPELLRVAMGRIKDKNVRFQIQNIEKMDFEDESFDVVFGCSVLHHLNLRPALVEIYRVLKGGGRIVFTEPNMLNPQIWAERNIPAIRRLTNNSPDETAFVKWKLKREFLNHGFKDIRIRSFDFLHPLTPRKLIQSIINIGNVIEKIPLVREIAGSLLIHASKL